MNRVIEEIYRSDRTIAPDGVSLGVQFSIDPVEGAFLVGVVASDSSIWRTSEVGCTYGLSAFHICGAIRDRPGATHYILDPNQSTHYRSAGVPALERAGLSGLRAMNGQVTGTDHFEVAGYREVHGRDADNC